MSSAWQELSQSLHQNFVIILIIGLSYSSFHGYKINLKDSRAAREDDVKTVTVMSVNLEIEGKTIFSFHQIYGQTKILS